MGALRASDIVCRAWRILVTLTSSHSAVPPPPSDATLTWQTNLLSCCDRLVYTHDIVPGIMRELERRWGKSTPSLVLDSGDGSRKYHAVYRSGGFKQREIKHQKLHKIRQSISDLCLCFTSSHSGCCARRNTHCPEVGVHGRVQRVCLPSYSYGACYQIRLDQWTELGCILFGFPGGSFAACSGTFLFSAIDGCQFGYFERILGMCFARLQVKGQ